jgi:dihydropteroate synthase
MAHALTSLLGTPAPWLMGVLNVTPNSFTDGGRFVAPDTALAHARAMIEAGAAIVDIGGESTAPGRAPVGGEVELARIEGVVATLVPEAVVSVDTYRAATAARCLGLGARIVNDVSAMRADPDMPAVVRAHGAILVMMHSKEPDALPHASDLAITYADAVTAIGDFLARRIDAAVAAGIPAERLVVDPGWGKFISLDPGDSWRLLEGFERLVERLAPVPVMVAASRKGFFGVPMAERDPVSQLTGVVGAMRGAAVLRTHDVRMARQFLDAGMRMGLRYPAAERYPSSRASSSAVVRPSSG